MVHAPSDVLEAISRELEGKFPVTILREVLPVSARRGKARRGA